MSEFIEGKLTYRGKIDGNAIVDVDGEYFAEIIFPMKKDKKYIDTYAQFIVTACNCHEDLVGALEKEKEIFSSKLREIHKKQRDAKDGLSFIESRYLSGIHHQIFELRMEIERMLNEKKLNQFCILMAFMTKENKKAALSKAEVKK